ncbi:MAG TPA: hypothetical protein VJR89_11520 [Polyangiales bacterium]|nr:hypothetical protein [Polyangiales bacterium]
MSIHALRLTCLLLATLLPGSALAEDPDVVNYTFEDDLVGATERSSNLEVLRVRTRKARESLIRVREHFIPELYESVEDL